MYFPSKEHQNDFNLSLYYILILICYVIHSETKLLADLQINLALEELAVQELTSLESNLRNNLWPEESSTMLPERKEDLS